MVAYIFFAPITGAAAPGAAGAGAAAVGVGGGATELEGLVEELGGGGGLYPGWEFVDGADGDEGAGCNGGCGCDEGGGGCCVVNGGGVAIEGAGAGGDVVSPGGGGGGGGAVVPPGEVGVGDVWFCARSP